jgi:cytochrome c oxidase assembly factor CtaG
VSHPWQLVLDPEWALALAIAAIDYAIVVQTYERRGEHVSTWRRWMFEGGLFVLALALFSPIEYLALHSMLSFHLLQNVMLGDWAPPLLLLGLTPAMAYALASRRWLEVLTRPSVALCAWLGVWYVTHLPVVYDFGLTHFWALGLEHVAFVVSGLMFWWPEIVPGVLTASQKVAYLSIALIAITPLDLFVYLAHHPLYPFYEHTDKLGSISALADQQIAGVAMAMEANTVLLVVIAVALFRMLSDEADQPAGGRPGSVSA